MLDQSFSAANFRKIVDIENRKGNYLEVEFLPDTEKKAQEIEVCKGELRSLRNTKAEYTEEEFESKSSELSVELEKLKAEKEEILLAELEKVSKEIGSKGFSFEIEEVDIGKPQKAFNAKRSASTFFAMKQLQHNIRRLYKVKQANRHEIVCQLRELLGDGFPKYVIRTDVSSFYETIPRKQLLKKLRDDPLLTLASKKLIRRVLYEYGYLTGSADVGLPRGIGISAYLAELYMRDIDRTIRDYPGVLFYARYVDDIFIIFCAPPNVGTLGFRRAIASAFKKLELKRNRTKTEIFKLWPSQGLSVQYLGYKFTFCTGSIELKMTDKKIARYKQRIDLSFSAYEKKSKKSEKNARTLLEKRVRFLTGNTRLVNNKKNVVSGVFFSNSLLNKLDDLDELDSYLATKISTLTSARLGARLLQHSFKNGFETRKYHKFSARDLSQIVEVWKHVS
ncbi:antiviral reverse transcriptase Drt3a [Thalassospira sp. ER-Se-21-Dark]|uniref:antiviral reverse transcriptase Drt3a n=1 Tax=Thalassospira sp. ER-Se-21-Dark TaxID=2585190 RepID=UPI001B3161CD|nr:antiviral reverse transcriptase Drt3a [Thalassospira sp. ER-Se-21-Dark]MBP3126077.1 RNA-directed DNA polymerase [Thalassospira sp. ER-Se-21-Dark]